jgi:multimeric flavodoxin WrbA
MVAEEFKRHVDEKGIEVEVHHIRDMKRKELAAVDLYVFSSPGRMGRPIGSMRRFLKRLSLPAGTKYAILTTEAAPKPDKKTGQIPTEEELVKYQRVRPIMNEILQAKGLVKVAEDKILPGIRTAAMTLLRCTSSPATRSTITSIGPFLPCQLTEAPRGTAQQRL